MDRRVERSFYNNKTSQKRIFFGFSATKQPGTQAHKQPSNQPTKESKDNTYYP
jgi:hypothetical protein